MPNIYSLLFGGIGAVGGVGYKAATSGTIGRSMIGAGVGAIYGGTQSESASGRVEGALKGAIFGTAGGAALGAVPRIARATPGMIWGGMKAATRSTGRLIEGKGIEGLARKAGMWTLNHPMAVAGIAGGLYAGASAAGAIGAHTGAIQSGESPYMSGSTKATINYNQRAIMLQEMGQIGGGTIGTPDQMQGRFDYAKWISEASMTTLGATRTGRLMDSTIGLPQGLHRGRHGG